MEKQTSPMSAEESLKIISEMLTKTREVLRNDSFYFLLWGWTVTFACVFNFALIRYLLSTGQHEKINLYSLISWGTVIFICIFLQFWHIFKKEKTTKVKTYLGDFIAVLWQANGVLIMIAWFFCMKYHIFPSPFILAICGCATFVTGILFKFKPMIAGSIFFILFAFTALWVQNEYQLLISAAAIIAGYLIPGYNLKSHKF